MNTRRFLSLAAGSLVAAVVVQSLPASETNFYSNVNGPTTAQWGTTAEWSTNTSGSGGTLSAVFAGGIYTTVPNANLLNGSGSYAYIRTANPTGSNSVTFPGDSFVLSAGTELRFIGVTTTGNAIGGTAGTTGSTACFYATPTNIFPGGNGLVGLVLNGGALDPAQGTAGRCFVLAGTISNVAGVTSYIFPGGYVPGGGASGQNAVSTALAISGQLSGSGTLAVLSGLNTLPNMQVTGTSNTYSGGWLLQSGWLQGVGDGSADGYNSLGTNSACSIVVNPLYQVPVSPSTGFAASNALGQTYGAVLDLGASTMNSAGTLTLTNCGPISALTPTNSGQMWVHGQYIFSAVTVNGTSLANGYYPYSALTNSFPGVFSGLPTLFTLFGGGITVRPYSATLPSFPPLITPEPPASVTAYVGGSTNIVSGAISQTTSTNVALRWYAVDGTGTIFTPVNNAGDITGATNGTLSFSSLSLGDATNYALVASNAGGVSTSAVVTLSVSTGVVITTQPVSASLFTGNNVQFTSGAAGAQPLSLQWYTVDASGTVFTPVANAGNVSGATTSVLAINNLVAGNATNFALVASNAFGATATSSIVSLTVTVGPPTEVNYFTDVNGSSFTNWTVAGTQGSPAIWSTNISGSGGTLSTPVPGGVYNIVWNGIQMNGAGTYSFFKTPYPTPYTGPSFVFPGDSLVINSGAELRIKDGSASATDVQSIPAGTTGVAVLQNANPTNIFPGANGFNGLVLNGGVLDVAQADFGINHVILGTIEAAPNTTSYIFPGGYVPGSGSQLSVVCALTIGGQLVGSGTLAVVSATNTIPGLQMTGISNNFTGSWILQGGWLQGVGDGAVDGYNSLGTNGTCSITVDPLYEVPTNGTGNLYFSTENTTNAGNDTLLDLGPGVMNSAGSLILTNNGLMWLHGHYIFSSVTINGTVLTNGFYSYNDLINNFPGNFTGLPANFVSFGGDITVRPYSSTLPTFAPTISGPSSQTAFATGNAQFAASVSGLQPIYLQWYTVDSSGTVFTPLHNGGEVSGATTATLNLTGITLGDAANYALIASNNTAGVVTSAVVSLTVYPNPAAFTLNYITSGSGGMGVMNVGDSWNTAGYWWDGNYDGGLQALTLAADLPAVPFVVPPGSSLRTVETRNTSGVTFPGAQLVLQGDGNFVNGTSGPNVGVLLYEGGNQVNSTNTGEINFPNLVMAGGQFDSGLFGTCIVDGLITIGATNGIFYEDASDAQDTGFLINAQLAGSGNIEIELDSHYTTLQSAFTNNVNFAGSSNTYTGTWLVGQGALLGSGTNSLGTNSITVGPNGALETMYDLHSPNASLTLNGLMYLHQNDTFSNVTVGGVLLPSGTYSAAALMSAAPANFPATWNQLNGSTVAVASGSITVLGTNGNAPNIGVQPLSKTLYAGETAKFFVSAGGVSPLSYQWSAGSTNGGPPYTNLTDVAGSVSGSHTAILTLQNITANQALDYYVMVSNADGSVLSSPATLTVVTPGTAYESNLLSLAAGNLVAYWRLDETAPPPTTAYDYAGGFNGTYGASCENGYYAIAGPQPPDYAGFESTNYAVYPGAGTTTGFVTVPALNVNTNVLTILAWINPATPEINADGIFFCRAGTTISGFCYGPNNGSGVPQLGYAWNNLPTTYGWSSGIVPPAGQWSLAALVITPTGATLALVNSSGMQSSNNPVANAVQNFDGVSYIGSDSLAPANRTFAGGIDEVAVLNTALSLAQIQALYNGAVSGTVFGAPPVISPEPVSTTNVLGGSAEFSAGITAGATPLTYQWYSLDSTRTIYTPLTNGNPGEISGATSANLTLSPIRAADATNYALVVTNSYGSVTSAVASLTILAPVKLATAYSGGNLTLTWSGGGSLLEATNLLGPWITNTTAASPYVFQPLTNGQEMYFRVLNVVP